MTTARFPNALIGTVFTCVAVLVLTTAKTEGETRPDIFPSAQAISDAIDDEFLFDPAVPTTIDVKTKAGVVKLTGVVGNLLAKDRAAQLAGMVRGVRAVVNDITVRPAKKQSAEELKADVTTALNFDPATKTSKIETAINEEGLVTLQGKVDSWPEKDLAEKVVMGVRGVTGIENKLIVENKIDRRDSEIKADILGSLRWDALVDHELIEVNVRDGMVRLDGIVGTWAERNWAHYHAWVAGVSDVDFSGLKIEKWARDPNLRKTKYVIKGDRAIEEGLIAALRYDPRVKSFKVTTAVLDGIVTLRGTVDNIAAKRAAERDANNTVGVVNVVNRIRVRPQPARADAEIANRIRSALVLDPYIEQYEISVNVVDGVAKLYGFVDLYFDKARAENVASRVDGVIDVENYIDVRFTRRPLISNPYAGDRPTASYGWYDYQPYRTPRSDNHIRRTIKANLWLSPFVNSADVTVKVDEGRAILTGTVDSMIERQFATENAYKGGATWVENKLKIEPGA